MPADRRGIINAAGSEGVARPQGVNGQSASLRDQFKRRLVLPLVVKTYHLEVQMRDPFLCVHDNVLPSLWASVLRTFSLGGY